MSHAASTSSERTILADSVSRLFADLGTADHLHNLKNGAWVASEWQAIEKAGLADAGVSEARGGSGADLFALATIIRFAAFHNVSVPLAETFLAEFMLDKAALSPRRGPLTIAPVIRQSTAALVRQGGAYLFSGELHRVPWARHAAAVVVAVDLEGRPATVVVGLPNEVRNGSNLADEPRDTLIFDGFPVPIDHVGSGPDSLSRDEVILRGSLLRAAAIWGALERVQEIAIRYVSDRTQFGKPIGKFQAVQQMVAVMASHVAACGTAVAAAIDAAERPGCEFEIAAAKARVSEAAGAVAALAHQVHGAIGISREYSLNFSTRRLWSWRDEFGSETEWSEHLGGMLAQIGADALWAHVTR